MVVGESEIQGQVRAAWEVAAQEGAAGPILDRLFRQALQVGKQVRSATRIGAGAASVSSAAVNLAEEVLDDLPGGRVLVIGAGRMAEATALALVRHGVREVVVASRSVGGARALAEQVGGRGAGLDRLAEELAGADIVIASTGAPHPVLRPAQVAAVMAARAGRPMVIVNIAVPRDVNAGVAGIAGVALLDIDDLERVVEANLNGRRAEALRGESYVRTPPGPSPPGGPAAGDPAIAALRARAEEIRRAELDRAADGWEGLSAADRARLDALTAAHREQAPARAHRGAARGPPRRRPRVPPALMRSRLRFIIAIGLAVVLGAWLAWTSLGGSLETYAGPGEMRPPPTRPTASTAASRPGRRPTPPPRPRAGGPALHGRRQGRTRPAGAGALPRHRARTSSRPGARWW